MYGSNKLENYTTVGQLGFPVTTAPANWVNSLVTKKIKCCQYGPRDIVIKRDRKLRIILINDSTFF